MVYIIYRVTNKEWNITIQNYNNSAMIVTLKYLIWWFCIERNKFLLTRNHEYKEFNLNLILFRNLLSIQSARSHHLISKIISYVISIPRSHVGITIPSCVVDMLELLTSGLINFVSALTFENPPKIFCFEMHTKRTCSQLKKKMGAKRPKSLVFI